MMGVRAEASYFRNSDLRRNELTFEKKSPSVSQIATTMSTEEPTPAPAPVLHQFVIYAPDKPEEGTFEKRLAVRSQHLVKVGDLIGKGYISAHNRNFINILG